MRFAGLALLIALVITAPSFAQTSTATLPVWSVGDTWTYLNAFAHVQTDTVTAANTIGYMVSRTEDGGSTPVMIRTIPNTFDWTTTTDILNNITVYNYFDYYRFPLNIGQHWTWEISQPVGSISSAGAGNRGSNNSQMITWTSTCTVKAFERATVPAGTYNSVRISCQQFNRAYNIGGTFTEWYAPSVKRSVKFEWSNDSYWGSLRGKQQLLESTNVGVGG